MISSIRTEPVKTAGVVDSTISESRTDSKVRRQQQEDDENGNHQADAEIPEYLTHRAHLPANLDSHSARQCPGSRDCLIDLAAGSAQIISAKVGGKPN